MLSGVRKRARKSQLSRRTALRSIGHHAQRLHARDDIVRSVHRSTCKRCGTLITPGHQILFDARVRLYVHAHCAKIMQLVLPTNRGTTSKSRVQGIPHGLKQRSLTSYTTEWERYSRFVARRGLSAVPGKDVPWDLALLTEYMEWRAETCKPSTLAGVFSILAHFGAIFGFLLPNSRDDHDSLGYR